MSLSTRKIKQFKRLSFSKDEHNVKIKTKQLQRMHRFEYNKKLLQDLLEALSAGSNSVPDTLQHGSALQVEDLSIYLKKE
jgi:hypothetical protein